MSATWNTSALNSARRFPPQLWNNLLPKNIAQTVTSPLAAGYESEVKRQGHMLHA